VITQDRHVIAQYLVSAATNSSGVVMAPENRGYAAVKGDGTIAWSDFQQTPNSHPVLWKSTTLGSGAFASTVAFTWYDSSGALPGLRVEHRDIANGAVVTTGIFTGDTSHIGSFDAKDRGIVGYGWRNSALFGNGAATTVLSGYFPHELAWGNFGSLGQHLIMAQFSDTITLLGTSALDTTATSPMASRTAAVQVSDLSVADFNGDGIDDVIASPFDYDGWGLSLAAEGGFVTAPSSQPHGVKIMRVAPTYPIAPVAVSRKTHGAAGPFDINLPLTGTGGVECRTGGPNNEYQIVLTFRNPVTVGGAKVTGGIGSVSRVIVDQTGSVAVNLTGVANSQTLTVTLTNISDGSSSGDLSVPMVVNIGDVNASGAVTTGDTNLCKAQALQPVTIANFRNDINGSGNITTGDVNLIKQHALSQF
jgi:hypothetical protein